MFLNYVALIFLQIARIMIETYFRMRDERRAAKQAAEQEQQVLGTVQEVVVQQVFVFHFLQSQSCGVSCSVTFLPDTRQCGTYSRERRGSSHAYRCEGDGTGEAEQEDEPPPAKQRKLEGHRKPVPIELKRKNSCQNL